MDLFLEYEEFKKLPLHTGIAYKYFSQFNIDDTNHIWFAGNSHHIKDNDLADAFKKFLKTTRKEIRNGMLKNECARRMWFWYAKLLDYGIFTVEVRHDIVRWMDICETVLL